MTNLENQKKACHCQARIADLRQLSQEPSMAGTLETIVPFFYFVDAVT